MRLRTAHLGRLLALGGLVLLLAGTGCTRFGPARAAAVVHPDWAGCVVVGAFRQPFQTPPDLGRGGVPDDFVPAAVVDCVVQNPDDSDTRAEGVQRRTSRADDLAALTAYLARPDIIGSRNQACPAMAWIPPWLFLTDAGDRWIQVQIPVDSCGFPLDWFDAEGRARWDQLHSTDTVVCRGPSTTTDDWCRPV